MRKQIMITAAAVLTAVLGAQAALIHQYDAANTSGT